MMLIGLTGGIASGKSTVAAMLSKANIPVIDADSLAREVTKKNSPAIKELVAVFGEGILTKDHALDRKKLANIVFNDEKLLRTLEGILHKKIEDLREVYIKELTDKGHQVIVYMAPLIFETGLQQKMTKTLLVVADTQLRMARIKKRDGLTHEDFAKRTKAQLDDKIKISMADEIIENNGNLDDLYKQLKSSWKKLTGMSLPLKNP